MTRHASAPGPRAAYRDTGAAMRESIVRALEHVDSRETRVLLAVYYLLPSYSRVTDQVPLAQIGRLAAIPGDNEENRWRHARRALNAWSNRGVIVWSPGRGRGARSWLSLAQPAHQPPLVQLVKRGPLVDEKGGRSEFEKGAADGPVPEKVSEKVSEKTATPLPFSESEHQPVKGSLQWFVSQLRSGSDERTIAVVSSVMRKYQHPEAALHSALEALVLRRSKPGAPLVSEARYFVATLVQLGEEGRYR